MHATSTQRAVVEPGGDQVVAHVGLHALGAFADAARPRCQALSARIPLSERSVVPLHDRGKVLVHADAGAWPAAARAVADIEYLRAEGVAVRPASARTRRSIAPSAANLRSSRRSPRAEGGIR